MHPVDFVNKWTGVTLTERSASQQHFLDLCDVLDVPKPAEVDKEGRVYTFEKGAAKSTGGKGWADVWYRGHFGWEYKGPHKDLDKAYDQLLRYKDDLENPPLLVVSDLDRIIIRTNFTGTVLEKHEITLATFADPDNQRKLRNLFDNPDAFKPDISIEKVTEEAAQRFGQIAQGLQARGENPHTVAHFLVQMLFCLFAADIGLLPKRVFSRLLDFGRQNPKQFRDQTQLLLETMSTGGFVAYETIPHFNGGLFREVHALELTPEEVGVLDAASDLDWSQVEPAIFGTLFERSLDPGQRSQLGAHYTGRADILRVVEPVVMQPLRRRWDEVKGELDALVARRDAATTTQTRRNREADIRKVLRDFTAELEAVTILDPACGSGNFLYVALNQLLTLEKEALTYGATGGGLPMGYPTVRPKQVTGMEINEYAQELAQVVIWIGYLQWMIGNGFGWTEPVLEDLQTIRLRDALLDVAPGPEPTPVAPGPVRLLRIFRG